MLYESVLLIGVVFFGFVAPNIALGMATGRSLPNWILLVHAVLVVAAYFLWFWRRDGRTLAMQTWKIQLTSADGAAAAVSQLLLRFALAWPSIFFCGVGLIWAVFDRDRQFLHDRLAGTRLVFTG
ncbi:MAG: hypothetical protein A2040_03930 [Rhodocyclales bacterium GWA2_65_19]|nr:MAG: hypothetical protein A2040_03930 [Rhodocyclales bacterium GWA2_65_19]